MASFSQLPSGRWRVQVRRGGTYKAETFDRKRDAEAWAAGMESQAKFVAVNGYSPPPADSTVADLIARYRELHARTPGRSKDFTLRMLTDDAIGKCRLASLSALTF